MLAPVSFFSFLPQTAHANLSCQSFLAFVHHIDGKLTICLVCTAITVFSSSIGFGPTRTTCTGVSSVGVLGRSTEEFALWGDERF